jgi:3-methylfumaryl-CoA hydratase
MFAGARMSFHRPLLMGRPATRSGTIRDIRQKTGRTGSLTFVTVGYTFHQDDELCIEEEQDIVYREPGEAVPAPMPVEPGPAPDGTWCRDMTADPRLLFRFSALTFNAHRIHYDRPYALHEEGYPGLVVHGPLTALLLAELVRDHADRGLAAFSFRGRAPLFDLAPFRLVGRPSGDRVELEVQGPDGNTTQTATAELAPAGA